MLIASLLVTILVTIVIIVTIVTITSGLWGVIGGDKATREKGWVSKEVLERHLFPPADANANVEDGTGTLTLVAGLPRVYETICGPRDEKKVTGVLKELGWTHRDVVKL